jgi:hypothetical protein
MLDVSYCIYFKRVIWKSVNTFALPELDDSFSNNKGMANFANKGELDKLCL